MVCYTYINKRLLGFNCALFQFLTDALEEYSRDLPFVNFTAEPCHVQTDEKSCADCSAKLFTSAIKWALEGKHIKDFTVEMQRKYFGRQNMVDIRRTSARL